LGVDGVLAAMHGKSGAQDPADGDDALAAETGDADFKALMSSQL
jgi:hypothetical protein